MKKICYRFRVVLFLLVLASFSACGGIKNISPNSGHPGDIVRVETESKTFERGAKRSEVYFGNVEADLVDVIDAKSAKIFVPRGRTGRIRVSIGGPKKLGGKSFTIKSSIERSGLDRVLQTPAGKALRPDQITALKQLRDKCEGQLTLHVNPAFNNPVWIRMRYPVVGNDPFQNAQAFLNEFGKVFQIDNINNLQKTGGVVRTDCCSKVRFSQKSSGFSVFSAGIEFVEDKRGWISEIRGIILPEVGTVAAPTITEAQARQRLQNVLNTTELSSLAPTQCLVTQSILPQLQTPFSVVWHFAIASDHSGFLNHWFIDGSTGNFVGSTISSVSGLAEGAATNDCMADMNRPVYHINRKTGRPDYVSWHHVGGLKLHEKDYPTPEAVVFDFLKTYPTFFGDGDPNRHQKMLEVSPEDAFGFRRVKTAQHYADLPVFGVGLRFYVSPDNRIWAISGNYLTQLKIDVTPTITPSAARSAAVVKKANAICKQCDKQKLENTRQSVDKRVVGKPELGIFPVQLAKPALQPPPSGGKMAMDMPEGPLHEPEPERGKLSYRIQFRDSISFVDAKSGDVLYTYGLMQMQGDGGHPEIRIYDADQEQRIDYAGFFGIDVDESDPDASGSDPEVKDGFKFAHDVMSYWYERKDLFPYFSYDLDDVMDNGGNDIHLIVDADLIDHNGNSLCQNAWYVPGGFGQGPDHMVFCDQRLLSDIVGHEMTHGVTQHSSGLIYADESGALNESYSDLFGELVFPDTGGTWIHNTNAPVPRDMENPNIPHMQNYQYPTGNCVGNYDNLTCDYGGVHTNSGIPSRAFVLLSDGIPNPTTGGAPITVGIGRDKTAALSFHTLTRVLSEWSGFEDQMLGMRYSCDLWLHWGLASILGITMDDCDQIPNAYKQVGVSPSVSTGWYHTTGFLGARGDETIAGPYYQGGCTLGEYILKLQNVDDPGMRIICSDISAHPDCSDTGNEINYVDEFGVRVTSWSEGSVQAQARVHWWRSNFEDIAWNIEFVPDIPSGKTIQNCEGEYIIQRKSGTHKHWSDFGVGGKDDEWVGPISEMPQGCLVTGVTLEKVDKHGARIGSTGYEVGNSHSGARISSSPIGTRDRRTKVHWWFDPFNIIRYRVIYTISGPVGVTCWQ